MDKQVFTRYAELKMQERAIKEEISAMAPLVLEEMRKEEAEKVPSQYGTFTRSKMTRWEYSPKVKDAEKRVKMLQEDEKRTGEAKSVEIETLKFYPPKDEQKDD